jgi:isopentenyl phosphate kinase
MTTIIKLGGAATTNKSTPDTLSPTLPSLTAQLSNAHKHHALILIHGAGSFGHPPAKKHRVKQGWTSSDEPARVKLGMALTRQRVLQLHQHILQGLQEAGVPALSVSTYDTVETERGIVTPASGDRLVGRVRHLLAQGFVPLLFGDAVLDLAWGCTILSGDALVHLLATRLSGVRRCVFVTDVAGIYSRDPKRFADAILLRRLRWSDASLAAAAAAAVNHEDEGDVGVDDVTGSMQSKWEWARRVMADAQHVSGVVICQVADLHNVLARHHHGHDNVSDSWTTILR